MGAPEQATSAVDAPPVDGLQPAPLGKQPAKRGGKRNAAATTAEVAAPAGVAAAPEDEGTKRAGKRAAVAQNPALAGSIHVATSPVEAADRVEVIPSPSEARSPAPAEVAVETKSAAMPQQLRLPAGWEAKTSSSTGKMYYVNKQLGATQWHLPAGSCLEAVSPGQLPAAPVDLLNDSGAEDADVPLVAEQTLRLPDADQKLRLPDGWEKKISSTTGKVYYVNKRLGETQWKPPAGSIIEVVSPEADKSLRRAETSASAATKVAGRAKPRADPLGLGGSPRQAKRARGEGGEAAPSKRMRGGA